MRELVASNYFSKKLGKFLKFHPELEKKTQKTFEILMKDVFLPVLETHKLSGKLKTLYGASINFEYRIVFDFDEKNVFLVNIGSHDEVY